MLQLDSPFSNFSISISRFPPRFPRERTRKKSAKRVTNCPGGSRESESYFHVHATTPSFPRIVHVEQKYLRTRAGCYKLHLRMHLTFICHEMKNMEMQHIFNIYIGNLGNSQLQLRNSSDVLFGFEARNKKCNVIRSERNPESKIYARKASKNILS